MNQKFVSWVLFFTVVMTCLFGARVSSAQGTTAFTYQGQLHDSGTNASGTYGMAFKLYDAVSGGVQVATTLTNNVTLANGLFSANLDFGSVFDGSARWLEITVTSGGTTQTLSPRVQLLPSPFAIYAAAAASAGSAASAATATVANSVAANSITTANLQNNAVTNPKLAASSVATANVQAGAITTSGLADGAVTNPKLAANAVATANIQSNTVTVGQIADGAVTNPKLAANAVAAANMQAGAVTTTRITDGAVTNPKLAANSVTTINIQDNAVTAAQIADGAVTNSKIAINSVTTSNIQNNAVTTAQLADGAVTNRNLATNAVRSGNIASGQVVKSLNGLTDAVTLQGVSNISITTSGNTLQFSATGNYTLPYAPDWSIAPTNISGSAGLGFIYLGNVLMAISSAAQGVLVTGDFRANRLFSNGDISGGSFYSSATVNAVTLNASGDVYAGGKVHANGCFEGIFCNSSDRNLKENFAPIDASDVLSRVLTLPITSWNFKTETNARHIGPMAQDFYSTFNVGEDDRHIAVVDEGGVALAAIQGLNEKLITEVSQKDSQIKTMEKRLVELERLVKTSVQK